MEIACARPYTSYTRGNRQPVKDAWFPFVDKGQRAYVSNIAGQSPGLVINRHSPPGQPAIAAELRPHNPIRAKAAFKYKEGDRGAKYTFSPTPRKPVEWEHDHADMDAERRTKHLEKHHGGAEYAGPHSHTKKVKDGSRGQAKKIDVHPYSLPLIADADRVFFVIEGCLKADAILSQGEAVFSVPSVTLWQDPTLEVFVREYLLGKTIFIVPDQDWHKNPLVIAQAMLCRSHLRRLGLRCYVAAPGTAQPHKGVDDFLGDGGNLDDLEVIGRESSPALERWEAEQLGRIDGVRRDAQVLESLALHATDDPDLGDRAVTRKAIRTFAGIMDTNPRNVSRGIASLLKRPGLESDQAIWVEEGSLATVRGVWKGGYYDRSRDWEDRPKIVIAPELRAVEKPPARLGDVTRGHSLPQFTRRSTFARALQRAHELADTEGVAA